MKTPESLETLVDYGVIDEVLRPLMSGKEALVYVVMAGGEQRVAKVYKEATQRTFKHRSEYTEGRRSRNTRDQRAVSKRTQHGRKQDEAAWRSTEVDMIYRLRDAGVTVPEPINFVDGVLVMELVEDAEQNPAPRLGDIELEAAEAEAVYQQLLREVVRMLCAGVIHGDLSEFNVLMGAKGPVLIDFPQAVDPAHNRNARKLLLRDVENLHRFAERVSPKRTRQPYAEEMWALYETNRLSPDTALCGDYRTPQSTVDTAEVLLLIDEVNREEQGRRAARGEEIETEPVSRPLRTVVDFTKQSRPTPGVPKAARAKPRERTKQPRSRPLEKAAPANASSGTAAEPAAPKRRRRNRRRRKSSQASNTRSETSSEGPTRQETHAENSASSLKNRASKVQKAANPRATGDSDAPKRRRRRRRSGTGATQPGTADGANRPAQPKSSSGKREPRSSRPAADTAKTPRRRTRRRSGPQGSRPTT